MDADMFEGLQDLLGRMDTSPNLRVVVFESANPDFYLAHFEVKDTARTLTLLQTVGPTGLPSLLDTFVRLTKSPVVSIAKIRGRARGVSSEFLLACDMRFASRENTALAQVEVGSGVHPAAAPLSAFHRSSAEARARNRARFERLRRRDRRTIRIRQSALPDKELDGFVDALARRMPARRRPIAAAKKLINDVSLPTARASLTASRRSRRR